VESVVFSSSLATSGDGGQALGKPWGPIAKINMMSGHQVAGQDMIEFAVPHSLALMFFPHWVMDLRKCFGAVKSRLVTLNVHDAVMQLTEGSCDLLRVSPSFAATAVEPRPLRDADPWPRDARRVREGRRCRPADVSCSGWAIAKVPS